MNIKVAFKWRIRNFSSVAGAHLLLFLGNSVSSVYDASRLWCFSLFPCFGLSSGRHRAFLVSFTESSYGGMERVLEHAPSVAIIYRSPFSGQVIPAKIVASVNYYRAPALLRFHLWISIVPRTVAALLRIILVKRKRKRKISRHRGTEENGWILSRSIHAKEKLINGLVEMASLLME